MDAKMAIEAIDDVLSSTINYDESLEYQLTSYDLDWLEEAKKALQRQDEKKKFCNLLGKCLVYSENLNDYNEMRKRLKCLGAKEFAEMMKSDDAFDYAIKIGGVSKYIDEILKRLEAKYGIQG